MKIEFNMWWAEYLAPLLEEGESIIWFTGKLQFYNVNHKVKKYIIRNITGNMSFSHI